MKVLHAPDYRAGNPYQRLLANAVEARSDIRVDFLSGYPRLLPLARGVRRHGADVLHLHWPEAYAGNAPRRWRFPLDLRLADLRAPLVLTAHNLAAHDRASRGLARVFRQAHRRARAIIVHSEAARDACLRAFGAEADNYHVIPHGDLSTELPPAPDRVRARHALGVDDGRVLLLFGRLAPYKGIEELLAAWSAAPRSWRLVIAGRPDEDYGDHLRALAAGHANVQIEAGWLDDDRLVAWLAAADAVICNYRKILTSGAAMLPRARGVPLLLPRAASTVDLDEPDPRVLRFDDLARELPGLLDHAAELGHDPAAATAWRERHSWERIADAHTQLYRSVLAAS